MKGSRMKMKLTVMHLWTLACVVYVFAIFMAFKGMLIGSFLFAALCLLLLTCTRCVVNHEEEV